MPINIYYPRDLIYVKSSIHHGKEVDELIKKKCRMIGFLVDRVVACAGGINYFLRVF